jgi:hypothetical protein
MDEPGENLVPGEVYFQIEESSQNIEYQST